MSLPDLDQMEGEEAPKKKSSIVMMIIIMAGLSAAAIGIGYVVGSMLQTDGVSVADTGNEKKEKKAKDDPGKENKNKSAEEDHGEQTAQKVAAGATLTLPPIVTSLRGENNIWLRLELALVVYADKSAPDEAEQKQIAASLTGFVRTLKMEQIFGPSGYLHLQEDLLDRARLSTDGAIKDVFILSMVAE